MQHQIFINADCSEPPRHACSVDDFEASWLHALGYEVPLPIAAWRSNHWQSPPFVHWLSVVSLEVMQRGLSINAYDDALALSEQQWQSLHELLQPLFQTTIYRRPQGLFIELDQPLLTLPVDQYGDVQQLQQFHQQYPEWARLLCECQMALKHSALNQQRTANGQATIDAIWLWGASEAVCTTPVATQLISDQPEGMPCACLDFATWLSETTQRPDKPLLFYLDHPTPQQLAGLIELLRRQRQQWVWRDVTYSKLPSFFQRLCIWRK